MNSTSLNEIAQSLLNEVRGGRSSNTEGVSLEHIKYAINYYRATFIRRDQERNFNRSQIFEQDLGHLPTKIVDTAEDDTITSGNTVVRTVNEIPTPIRLKRSLGITHISCPDKVGRPIPLISDQRSYWEQFNKFTSDNIHASFRNGYIYIFNDVSIDTINIRGIFEDPEEVFRIATAEDGTDLYDGSQPYPISQDMLEGIKKAILGAELKTLVSSLNDDETDVSQDEQ